MEEFKSHKKGNNTQESFNKPVAPKENAAANKKEVKAAQLAQERSGWYLGTIVFKRVLPIGGTTKFRYQDTTFQAYIKANSGNECYDRIISHLKKRIEIDPRSQFPSAKGNNFTFEFVGSELPTEQTDKA